VLDQVALVELLFWDGCPSHPAALADLQAALGPEVEVVMREVVSEEDAAANGFPGSYRLRDGRFSPTPDPLDLREALERAGCRTVST
jgi:hypothetical protein